MGPTFPREALPLEADEDGVVRVGGTRVTLETIVTAFIEGATAEELVQQYPSLALADVYQVIGYYLHRPQEVMDHIEQRGTRAEAVRAQNEFRFDPQGVRDRLVARSSHRPR
jgi:uncharacterized protein (DUF433 family)